MVNGILFSIKSRPHGEANFFFFSVFLGRNLRNQDEKSFSWWNVELWAVQSVASCCTRAILYSKIIKECIYSQPIRSISTNNILQQ